MSNKLDKRTNCLYCDKALDAKYRSKKFCDDKCRIYWNRENKSPKIKDLRGPTNVVKPLGSEKPKSNFTVNTTLPPKLPGESALDYRIRCEELRIG